MIILSPTACYALIDISALQMVDTTNHVGNEVSNVLEGYKSLIIALRTL